MIRPKTINKIPEGYKIDLGIARKVIRFINNLKHTSGRFASETFRLRPWQRRYLIHLIACVSQSTGERLFRESFFFIARKSGKTELIAAIAIYFLFCEPEESGQIIIAAATRDQASLLYNAACYMVMTNPILAKNSKVIASTKRIIYPKTNSVLRVISSDANTAHGLNCSLAIIDELHTQKNDDLFRVLRTSMGARQQPLFISISTAGSDRNGICYEVYDYSKKVCSGQLQNDNFLPVIYEVDRDEDWQDEQNWYKANPALGDFRSLDDLRQQFEEAKQIVARQAAFRMLYLNQWQDSAVRWISSDVWDAAAIPSYSMQDLAKYPCYLGLDLSSTRDLTALAKLYVLGEGQFYLDCEFFCPQDTIVQRSKSEGIPYYTWSEEGFIHAIPGAAINQSFIRARILELVKTQQIKEVCFDPWQASQLVEDLTNDGATMIPIRQGFASLSAPTKEFERLVLTSNLKHCNNKVLNWNIGNVLLKVDPAGNIKPDKAQSTDKIDGAVASIMALARAVTFSTDSSPYETGELKFI